MTQPEQEKRGGELDPSALHISLMSTEASYLLFIQQASDLKISEELTRALLSNT